MAKDVCDVSNKLCKTRYSLLSLILIALASVLLLLWPASILLPIYKGVTGDYFLTSEISGKTRHFILLGPNQTMTITMIPGKVILYYDPAALMSGGWRRSWSFSEFDVPLLGWSLWGLVVLSYVLARPWILRSWRRGKNLCVFCSYPRVGLGDRPCPECGTPVPPNQRIPSVNPMSTKPQNEPNANEMQV